VSWRLSCLRFVQQGTRWGGNGGGAPDLAIGQRREGDRIVYLMPERPEANYSAQLLLNLYRYLWD
jgi:hypothetical protein